MRASGSLIGTAMIFMLLTGAAVSDILWDLGDYSLRAYEKPQVSRDEGEMISFITAALEKTPEGEIKDEIGIVFNPKEGDTFWVYEIYDVEADRLVKQVTLNEMLGLAMGKGCELVSNEQFDEKTIIARYRINPEGYDLILTRVTKLIEDPNLPGIGRIIVTFEFTNRLSGMLKLRFTERHRNDDYAFSEGANTLYTVNKQAGHDGWPILVQSYALNPAELSVDNVSEERAFSVSAATWQPVEVQKQADRASVAIGKITLAVANFRDMSLALEQARNIAGYLATDKSKPQLSVVMEVDKKEAYPGDVLTYQLMCFNIGTGKAVDGSILDPLPESILYLPDSASGEKTRISYSMDGGKTFQPQPGAEGRVTHIKWDVSEPINAGESIKASFQATVREE